MDGGGLAMGNKLERRFWRQSRSWDEEGIRFSVASAQAPRSSRTGDTIDRLDRGG